VAVAGRVVSLRRMGTIDGVRVVLPAHGHPFEDLDGRAKAIRRHHEHRLNVIRHAAGEPGTGTVPQYLARIFAPRSWAPLPQR